MKSLSIRQSTAVLSSLRFGALSIWVGLGVTVISFVATILLLWGAANWIERPFSLNSPHADLVFWRSESIRQLEMFGHAIGFCLGVAAIFHRGDRGWLGFIGVCLNVLLSSEAAWVRF
jgi:hypothetical protein